MHFTSEAHRRAVFASLVKRGKLDPSKLSKSQKKFFFGGFEGVPPSALGGNGGSMIKPIPKVPDTAKISREITIANTKTSIPTKKIKPSDEDETATRKQVNYLWSLGWRPQDSPVWSKRPITKGEASEEVQRLLKGKR